MKKALSLLLALAMVFALVACGGKTSSVDLKILKEADEKMLNTYSAIAVNPDAPFVDADGNSVTDVYVNTAGADALIQWLLSETALKMAGEYGHAEYGEYLFYVLDNAPKYTGEIAPATEETKVIRLSTTTSVKDSGLLGYLLPEFESAYGYTVEVQSAGTGKAIAAAKNGNADLILVHSKSQEEDFVNAGFGRVVDGFSAERVSFIYNYFVLCGPSKDPASVAKAASVLDAFAAIAEGKHTFISRGDGSGTHTKELSLWPAELGIAKEAESLSALITGLIFNVVAINAFRPVSLPFFFSVSNVSRTKNVFMRSRYALASCSISSNDNPCSQRSRINSAIFNSPLDADSELITQIFL